VLEHQSGSSCATARDHQGDDYGCKPHGGGAKRGEILSGHGPPLIMRSASKSTEVLAPRASMAGAAPRDLASSRR
jgi:hypothetical protein